MNKTIGTIYIKYDGDGDLKNTHIKVSVHDIVTALKCLKTRREQSKKHNKTPGAIEKQKARSTKYYYKKKDLYHPLYNKEGKNPSKYSREQALTKEEILKKIDLLEKQKKRMDEMIRLKNLTVQTN